MSLSILLSGAHLLHSQIKPASDIIWRTDLKVYDNSSDVGRYRNDGLAKLNPRFNSIWGKGHQRTAAPWR